MREAFERAYAEQHWGSGSGPGSTPASLAPYHAKLRVLLHALKVTSVLDLGCGLYAPHAAFYDALWRPTSYTGVDCVPAVVDENHKYTRGGPAQRRFIQGDALELAEAGHLPAVSCTLLKDVLQHWSNADVARMLEALQGPSSTRLVLITNTTNGVGENEDCEAGGFRPLDVMLRPFHLPAEHLFEYLVTDNPEPDLKRTCLWEPGKKRWLGLR